MKGRVAAVFNGLVEVMAGQVPKPMILLAKAQLEKLDEETALRYGTFFQQAGVFILTGEKPAIDAPATLEADGYEA